MSDWREKLVLALKAKGLDMKAASTLAGLNPTAVQQISKGNDPKASTLLALGLKHGISLDEILLNRSALSTVDEETRNVRLATVVGTAAAGIWFSPDSPQIEPQPVPYVPCRYPDLEQTAYKVIGPSMNRRKIEDGDFVIVVPYWEARIAPVAGDIAIIERSRDGGLIETTVKEIEITKTAIRLIPRSTDPEFQEAVSIPRSLRPELYEDIRIIGLVVGKFSGF